MKGRDCFGEGTIPQSLYRPLRRLLPPWRIAMMQKRPCRGLDMRYSSSDRTRDTSASRGSLARAAVKGKCPITSAAHARHPVYLPHLRKSPASVHSARRTYFRKFPVPNSYPLRTLKPRFLTSFRAWLRIAFAFTAPDSSPDEPRGGPSCPLPRVKGAAHRSRPPPGSNSSG